MHFCNKAVPEAMCQENTHKVMSSLESYSHGLALRLDAQLVGTDKVRKLMIIFSGIKCILLLGTLISLIHNLCSSSATYSFVPSTEFSKIRKNALILKNYCKRRSWNLALPHLTTFEKLWKMLQTWKFSWCWLHYKYFDCIQYTFWQC